MRTLNMNEVSIISGADGSALGLIGGALGIYWGIGIGGTIAAIPAGLVGLSMVAEYQTSLLAASLVGCSIIGVGMYAGAAAFGNLGATVGNASSALITQPAKK